MIHTVQAAAQKVQQPWTIVPENASSKPGLFLKPDYFIDKAARAF